MNETIRIKLSAGLLILALLHAVAVVSLFEVVHQPLRCNERLSAPWSVPAATVEQPSMGKLTEPPAVNWQAQGEVKQQCIDCTTSRLRPAPRVLRPAYVPAAPVVERPMPVYPQPLPTFIQPVPTPVQPVHVPVQPETPNILIQPAGAPTQQPSKNYQLALFLGNEAKSSQLQDWFNRDPRLLAMRQACEFQVYSANNPLYKARYAKDVPVEQFPVVLLQDKNGGHIHAAGHTMIPANVDALYADFRKGFELYQQARQAQKTGAIKSRGYSWDAAISPTMQLQSGDCPDGFCPEPNQDSWQPGQRVRDLLFDTSRDARDALLWTSGGEIATVVLVVVAVILIGIIIMKRNAA